MLPLLGLLAAFVVIFALRARNLDFSLTMFAASAIIGVTSGRPLSILMDVLMRTAMDPTTHNLVAAVALITVLGYILEETGMMVELIDNLRGLLPSRILLALTPALFGLMTMPGGALMSAPFNEPEAKRLGLKPEQKTYINVWFRHIWYWTSPISSTVILTVSISGVGLREFITANIPIFLATIAIGLYMSSRFIREGADNGVRERRYGEAVKGISPIAVSLILSLMGVPIWLALLLGIGLVFLLKGVGVAEAPGMAWRGMRPEIVAAVFAMLYFRYMVEESGSVTSLSDSVLGLGIPLLVILLALPLMVGVISGTPIMGIGIVFPLLLPLFPGLNVHIISVMLAGIVCTYVASPIHLCLILTNAYYRSDFNRVYPYLLPSCAALYVAILAYHLSLSGLL
jgi:integral membrane protein (TIGR00529 family)